MPQYLVAIHHPNNYDPSVEGESDATRVAFYSNEQSTHSSRLRYPHRRLWSGFGTHTCSYAGGGSASLALRKFAGGCGPIFPRRSRTSSCTQAVPRL